MTMNTSGSIILWYYRTKQNMLLLFKLTLNWTEEKTEEWNELII